MLIVESLVNIVKQEDNIHNPSTWRLSLLTFIFPMLSKHSILECITQIAFKSKSTTIITSSSEQHPECVCW